MASKEFGPRVRKHLDTRGIRVSEFIGRVSAHLRELGQPASYRPQTAYAMLRGEAGRLHLSVEMVEAICRAAEVTDPLGKAELFSLAGHQPPSVETLEQYAKAFEGLEARAS
jgi:hypothetical protein